MELINIIIYVLLFVTTVNTAVQVITGLIEERKAFQRTGESFPKWTYSYTIVPQLVFIIVGCIVLRVPTTPLSFTFYHVIWVTLGAYILYIISTLLGNLIVALLQKRDK